MTANFLTPLLRAISQCALLILIGFGCRHAGFAQADVQGLSRFVGRLALPGLLFRSMATLDVSAVDWRLVATLCLAKLTLFIGTIVTCYASSAAERSLARGLRQPLVQTGGESGRERDRSGSGGSGEVSANPPAAAGSRAWCRRAGLSALFCTQSNDFALGLPLFRGPLEESNLAPLYPWTPMPSHAFARAVAPPETRATAAAEAIWQNDFDSTVFCAAPFQLAVLNPLAFMLLETSVDVHGLDADSRARICLVLRKVLRSPVVLAVALGLLTKLVLLVIGHGAELPCVALDVFGSLSKAFTATALITL
jgi:hypothetical protein